MAASAALLHLRQVRSQWCSLPLLSHLHSSTSFSLQDPKYKSRHPKQRANREQSVSSCSSRRQCSRNLIWDSGLHLKVSALRLSLLKWSPSNPCTESAWRSRHHLPLLHTTSKDPNLCPALSLNKSPPSLDISQPQLQRIDNSLYEDIDHYSRRENAPNWGEITASPMP